MLALHRMLTRIICTDLKGASSPAKITSSRWGFGFLWCTISLLRPLRCYAPQNAAVSTVEWSIHVVTESVCSVFTIRWIAWACCAVLMECIKVESQINCSNFLKLAIVKTIRWSREINLWIYFTCFHTVEILSSCMLSSTLTFTLVCLMLGTLL